MPDPEPFDFGYQPRSYWVFKDGKQEILAKVKGEVRRESADAFMGQALGDEARESLFLMKPNLSVDECRSMAVIHPSCLGGEFLPDLRDGEVEIARLVLASVTQDVISIRARRRGGRIHYSVRDEYETEGSFQYRFAPKTSRAPLSMRKVVRLIDSIEQGERYHEFPEVSLAAPGLPAYTCWLNDFNVFVGDGDLDGHRYFVRVTSGFYPELEAWYKAAGEEWHAVREREFQQQDEWAEASLDEDV